MIFILSFMLYTVQVIYEVCYVQGDQWECVESK